MQSFKQRRLSPPYCAAAGNAPLLLCLPLEWRHYSREATMETKALDQVLGQLRTAAAMAGGTVAKPATDNAVKGADFAAILKASLDQANGMQQQAAKLARDFELGAAGTSLPDVMVSLQKANVQFQQTVQVRNRLVAAYHEIMNMQV
jgi:flagellar hook-basal body complex protein FliE